MSDRPFTDRVDAELNKRDLDGVSTGELLIVKALLLLALEVRSVVSQSAAPEPRRWSPIAPPGVVVHQCGGTGDLSLCGVEYEVHSGKIVNCPDCQARLPYSR